MARACHTWAMIEAIPGVSYHLQSRKNHSVKTALNFGFASRVLPKVCATGSAGSSHVAKCRRTLNVILKLRWCPGSPEFVCSIQSCDCMWLPRRRSFIIPVHPAFAYLHCFTGTKPECGNLTVPILIRQHGRGRILGCTISRLSALAEPAELLGRVGGGLAVPMACCPRSWTRCGSYSYLYRWRVEKHCFFWGCLFLLFEPEDEDQRTLLFRTRKIDTRPRQKVQPK